MTHWKNIKVAADGTHFIVNGVPAFHTNYYEVLKFHAPGLAPVVDQSGAYHIDTQGKSIYSQRYKRTFGYYFLRSAVIDQNGWRHIDENGKQVYSTHYAWVGNFQENRCAVRDQYNSYFHIHSNGERVHDIDYVYAGDFKDGVACVKSKDGYYRHIDNNGVYINDCYFLDLGIFHKGIATAKDNQGWFHINRLGKALYGNRYLAVEPFYNGFALVTCSNHQKMIINEQGDKVINV